MIVSNRPGDVYRIYTTILDIELKYKNQPVGRPTLHFVKDELSHYIVGFYVGLEEGLRSVNLALYDAFTKPALLSSKELDGHNYCAVPRTLCVDRGVENLGFYSNMLTSHLNIGVRFLAESQASKARLERLFGEINKQVGSGSKNAPHRPIFTMNNLQRLIETHVEIYNNSYIKHKFGIEKIDENAEKTPKFVWEWGLKSLGDLPLVPLDVVVINLLPHGQANITRKGVFFNNMYYSNSYKTHEAADECVDSKIGTKLVVAYHPFDESFLYNVMNTGELGERYQLI